MSLPIAISDILQGHAVEWERLDFKESLNPLKVLATLCAFANDFRNLGGGYVVIGVAEKNGRPVLPPVGISPEEADHIPKGAAEPRALGHLPDVHPARRAVRRRWQTHPGPLGARRTRKGAPRQDLAREGQHGHRLVHPQELEHREGGGR